MTARKLQNEIDRVLKKVGEGTEEFEETMEKVQSSTTNNQREKHEADLKKEIKKLQRLRDQIKTWIASNDVKDKQPLIDARKAIECLMEQFRNCERESKTKAYSKEGLQMQSQKADKKSKTHSWFRDTIRELTEQLHKFECELERIEAEGDPDDLERSITLEHWVDRHKFHIDVLEKIQRAFDNNRVSLEPIKKVMAGMKEYLEENQEPDFYENEELYEESGISDEILRLAMGDDGERDEDDGDEDSSSAASKPSATPAPKPVPISKEPLIIQPAKKAAAQASPSKSPAKNTSASQPAQSGNASGSNVSGNNASSGNGSGGGGGQTGSGWKKSSQGVPEGNAAQPPIGDEKQQTDPRFNKYQQMQMISGVRGEDGKSGPQKRSGPASTPSSGDVRLDCLEASLQYLPGGIDTASDREEYIPRNPYPTPPYYPDAPLPLFEKQSTFEKLDTDTLFFIFYYHQGTYQQYLAARELKKRSWRYHKKYLTWFQRHEEPKEITAEFEQGTYVYFDYETGWCQRKKTEFTFEYRYLEDGD